ncbi:hypothetical protein [Neisseria arctica]|uniref:hypothetical protein n=1 Tax=Neisseria arctica TaxID=1470200 RepID=UPI00069C19F2|nr:hypothetical protein [Neisseria arctica]UOO87496.1 hypothetical protein LVJ86_04425 [Neisseria arctica]
MKKITVISGELAAGEYEYNNIMIKADKKSIRLATDVVGYSISSDGNIVLSLKKYKTLTIENNDDFLGIIKINLENAKPEDKSIANVGWTILILGLLLTYGLYSCGTRSTSGIVKDNAIGSYPESAFPKLYAKWGADGVKRIIANDKAAAAYAARSGKCDVVEFVAFSERSLYPHRIVSFVDCRNGTRIYYDSSMVNK